MRTSTAAAFVNYQKTREFEKGPARPFAVLQDVFGLRGRSICIGVAALTLVGATSSPARAQSSITPYLRSIVSHYAPILIAETDSFSSNPEAVDHILPVDFDNDPYGYNNADHANSGLVINGKSTAYYSIVETGTTTEKGYFFVNFYFYHARDAGVHFSSPFGEKTGGSHDHDLEGVMLIVRKAFGAPYGVLIGAYSEAHGALIPYANPAASIQIPNAAGGNFRGMIQFWNEVVFNVDRPVVAIRSRKHGTYMAQDCSGQSPVYDLAGGRLFGMWKGSPQTMHKYAACIHNDGNFISYVPIPLDVAPSSGIGAGRLGPTVRNGTYWYQLVELVASPIWQLRTTTSLLYNPLMTLSGGLTAFGNFHASIVNFPTANPPWAWRGGRGECQFVIIENACWYSFGEDNTSAYDTPIDWPTSPANGQLLTNPGAEVALRFPGLPYTTEPFRYNPYIANPPACCSTYPLSAQLSGPTNLLVGNPGTWTATTAGGSPPYSYRWTGAFTGTSASVGGAVAYSRPLYLDVTDAAGAHIALSTFISVSDPDRPCGGQIAC